MKSKRSKTTTYVLGFAFDEFDNVLLIQKSHPEWMKDNYNGLGGKVELFEAPIDAMVREFKEESGIETFDSDWKQFATMRFDDGEIHVFKATLNHDVFINRPTLSYDEGTVFGSKFEVGLLCTCVPYMDSLISLASYDNLQVEISIPSAKNFNCYLNVQQNDRKRFLRYLADENSSMFIIDSQDNIPFMKNLLKMKGLESKFFLGASGCYRTSQLKRYIDPNKGEVICWSCINRKDGWSDVTVIHPNFYESSFPTDKLVNF